MVESVIPPVAFATVSNGVHRSSHPSTTSYPFLQTLQLKTAICVDKCDIRKEFREFCVRNDIVLIERDVGFNQEPFIVMSQPVVQDVINVALDPKYQPCLIFCGNGKLKTSTVIGCLRMALNWSFTSTIDEFVRYAGPEGGLHDIQFIENFRPSEVCRQSDSS
mmetsp:Transcript_25030/g.36950  ORF Transcript_25030/g.36950 Transcript_25030/m.36950 type:complete len:163 (+) Transcript_25030:32-520(+)